MVKVSFCCSNLPYISLSIEENEKKNGIERRKKKKRGRRRSRGSEVGEKDRG